MAVIWGISISQLFISVSYEFLQPSCITFVIGIQQTFGEKEKKETASFKRSSAHCTIQKLESA